MPVEIVWQGTPVVTLAKNGQGNRGNEYLFLVTPSKDDRRGMPNPFAAVGSEPTQAPAANVTAGPWDGPVVNSGDNWVSFSFNSAPGYDRIGATVHGEPEFVARVFGVENFNGKISTLMKQAVKVDEYFKKQYGDSSGKA